MKKIYLFTVCLFLLLNNLFSQEKEKSNTTSLNNRGSLDSSTTKECNQENYGNVMFKIDIDANKQVTVSNLDGDIVARHKRTKKSDSSSKLFSKNEKSSEIKTEYNTSELGLSIQRENASLHEVKNKSTETNNAMIIDIGYSQASNFSSRDIIYNPPLMQKDYDIENKQKSNSMLGSPNLGFYTGAGSVNSCKYDESTHQFEVTFSVANFGTASAGTFRVGCYVSTDTLITPNDYRPGSSVTIMGGLASNKFSTFSKSADLDDISGLPQGTYYFGLYADDLYEVAESNEADNAYCYKPGSFYGVASLPNLGFYTGTGSVVKKVFNETTNELVASICVVNRGSADAGSFRTGFYLSTDTLIKTTDYLLTSITKSSLAAGYYSNLSDTINLDNISSLPKGTYYLGFLVDDLKQVSESDETDNNIYFTSPLNYVASLPNLGFYTGAGSGNSFQYDESTHQFEVTFSVANFGTASAGTFRVGCYVSTDTLITPNDYRPGSSVTIMGGLGPNKFSTFSKSADLDDISGLPQGTYYFGLYADDLYEVAESNEADNGTYYKPNVSFSPVILSLLVSQNVVAIDNNANSNESIIVTSNTSWSVVSDQTWLTVNPSSGINNGVITFTAAANTTNYTRTATVTVSATGVETQTITVMQVAGTNSISLFSKEAVYFYPNPVTDGFQIRGIEGDAILQICDLDGKVRISKKIMNDEYILTNTLTKGIYLVKVYNNKGTCMKQLVKE
jgi:hypothetical protein